jgi:galactose oxidase
MAPVVQLGGFIFKAAPLARYQADDQVDLQEDDRVKPPREASTTSARSATGVGVALLLVVSLLVGCMPTGPVEIVAVHSGKCLSVPGGSSDDGLVVVQFDCVGVAHQRFTFVAQATAGQFRLEAQHSGKCLTVAAGSTELGARIVQQPCDGQVGQLFRQTAIGQLQAAHSGLCLDVSGASAISGAALQQWNCADEPNQQFQSITRSGAEGRWDAVVDLNIVPAAMANLPSGEVLIWSAFRRNDYLDSTETVTETAIFNPATAGLTNRLVAETDHDFFCPGIANLADGRLLINGGTGPNDTTVYDPATNTWINEADMAIGRGYNSSLTLADGSVLTVGGSWSGGRTVKESELWRPEAGWNRLSGIRGDGTLLTNDEEGIYRSDNHMWLFSWTGGLVFQAGPSRTMHWMRPFDGPGSVTPVGPRGTDGDAMNGNAVMYDTGRILTLGGAPNYISGQGSRRAHVIDIRSATAANPAAVTVREVESMRYRRVYSSSVVLPNGEVVVMGGQRRPLQFSDDRSVMIPELFNPFNESWSQLAPMAVPRNYHSAAILLADGRVMVGGGGLCGGCPGDHPDVQIFTPPYLLDAQGNPKPRPTITSAPAQAAYGSSIRVRVGGGATQLVLVRLSNSTHSVNNAQRRLTLTSAGNQGGVIDGVLPSDAGIAPPGTYWLFALDADGTPSLGQPITLG